MRGTDFPASRRALALLVPSLAALVAVGCSTPPQAPAGAAQRFAQPLQGESDELGVALTGVLAAGHPQTLVRDPGWREYLLKIDNRADAPVVIHTVKLLNREGRYLDSAANYAEIHAPPDTTERVATGIAKSTAGVVAGQLVPFGGYFVSVVSTTASAVGAQSTGNARQDFVIRKLKAVELEPGGRVSGSAFLPNILDPDSLVVDYSKGAQSGRLRIQLPPPGTVQDGRQSARAVPASRQSAS
ncbi:MAG: hypothetical protein K9M02_09200 [Thiohalocapsa sp.]|nr:hypothetical protein [Thiohalocapsa sp.]